MFYLTLDFSKLIVLIISRTNNKRLETSREETCITNSPSIKKWNKRRQERRGSKYKRQDE